MKKIYAFNPGMPLLWLPPKLFLIMRLIIIIMTTCLIHASAEGYAQKITFAQKGATLKEVFKQIRIQTGYEVFYQDQKLDDKRKIDAVFHQSELTDVIDKCLEGQQLTYIIEDRGIVIKEKDPTFLERVVAALTYTDVICRVVDANGKGLPGASVAVKGKNKKVSTDQNGEFFIREVEEKDILVISYVGYQPLEISVKEAVSLGKIVLKEIVGELDETVVKGYYITSKQANTGNVTTVKGETLARQVTGDPMVALTGQVAGLSIIPTSGIPGDALTVRLRGQNSIANGNNPLYIVDGVPYTSTSMYDGLKYGLQAIYNASPFGALRLTDIESIEVLKDADATAIYGSRGANGVVLITTKKGKEGKTRINVNVYQGAGKVSNTLKLMNTQQYLSMRNQAYQNDGTTPGPYDYDVNGTWDQSRYTDWQKELIGKTARVTDGQISLSGGGGLTQFRISGGYRKESSVFVGDFYDQKGSGQVNLNHQTEDNRLHVNLNLSYVHDQNRMPLSDFTTNILLAPNTPAIYTDGSLNWEKGTWENPLWQTRLSSTGTTNNLNTGLNLDYSVWKELKFSVRLGYNNIRLDYANLNPTSDNPYAVQYPSYRTNNFGNKYTETWIAEPVLSYDRKLGPGRLEALIGSTFQQSMTRGISQTASGFTSNDQISNVAAAADIKILVTVADKYRYSALYTRIGYNIRDKYILNLTGRRDASSRFGPAHQIGNFGAAGAAWVFSKEPFFNLPFLSFGKIRGSYGITGNDQLESYKYLSTYSNNPSLTFQDNPILVPTQLTNPLYSWESVKKLETGLELGFLKDRIRLNTSWYRHRTGNQLVGYNLPVITGFSSVTANLPAVLENSGLEFDLSTRNIETANLTWSSSFNISFPRNKLVSYPGLESSSYAYTYVIGRPLSIKYLYHYSGFDKNKGAYTFEDLNGDGQITYDRDRKDVFVGQKFYGGFSNSFSYKKFQLDIFINFAKQNGYDVTSIFPPGIYFDSGSNQKITLIEGVNQKNNQPFTSSLSTDVSNRYFLYTSSDAFVVDASYIRLKNVSLSWTLPDKIMKAAKMAKATVYVQAQNLFTITSYKGLDPEIPAYGPTDLHLPTLRMFTAGIDLTF